MTTATNPRVRDKRVQLRIKIKSLAAEARIIRQQEQKTKKTYRKCMGHFQTASEPLASEIAVSIAELRALHVDLQRHRVTDVRREARASLLAYALLRGKTYASQESARTLANPSDVWTVVIAGRVAALVSRFGPATPKQIDASDVLKWFAAAPA